MNWRQKTKRFPWSGVVLVLWLLLNAVLMITNKIHIPTDDQTYEQNYDLSDPGEID